MRRVHVQLLVVLSVFCLWGCSDTSTSSSSSSSENGLSDAFPTSFAISSPFSESDSSSTSSKVQSKSAGVSFAATAPEDLDSVDDKIADLQDVIGGSTIAACELSFSFFKDIFNPSCYGPAINFTDHEDAGGGPNKDGQLPSGDLGIWNENETVDSEEIPCGVAKLNERVANVEARIDFATDLLAFALCVAKVNGEDTLPAAGEEKDLSTIITNALALDEVSIPMTVTSIKLSKEDDCDGNDQYLMTANVTITDTEKSIEADISLRHTKENDDNTVYSGRLTSTLKGDFGPEGNCGGANAEMIATSIGYEGNSDDELLAQVESANFCDDTADPFDSNNRIDEDNTYDETTNPDGWAANYNSGIFNEGRYSFKWQAGRLDSDSRNIFGDITTNSDDLLEGNIYFGFSPNLDPVDHATKMIGNWAGPNNSHTPGLAALQAQKVLENATTGNLESVTADLKINYAPTNSGNATVGTYDGRTAPITADLFDVNNLSFTAPTAPDICGE